MVRYLAWLLGTYVMLKLIHVVLGGRAGIDDAPPRLRQRLLGGEPALFAAAFLMSVPVPLLIKAQLHRGYARGFQLATDCYGRIAASRAVPRIRDKIGPWKLYEASDRAQSLARLTGQLLDFKHDIVTAALSNKTHLYARRYAALTWAENSQGGFEQEAAVRSCFKTLQDIEVSPPWL